MYLRLRELWVVTLFFCLLSAWVHGETGETSANRGVATPRILLIGDSWAQQIGAFDVFETVLAGEGLSNVSVVKEGIAGSTAAQWASNDGGKLDTITTQLTNNPTIDIVHINLGGNDVFAGSPLESIADNIDIVVDHIHSINPNVRVALGSYDYIAVIEFNPVLIANVPISVAHAATEGRYEFINATGYIHYVFGFPGEFGPGETPIPGGFPEYDPAGGGDPAFAGNPNYNDSTVHLNLNGYVAYIARCFNEFYRPWLFEDVYGAEIWIDFAHRGDEIGISGAPMNDLTNAVTMLIPGGTIKIKGGTADSSTPETLTLDKAMRIEAIGGSVTIGDPGARRSSQTVEVKSGFVSQRSR